MIGTMLRIRSAKALDDYRVRLTLTDGETVERDLTDIIWGPVFQPLLDDYARFRQVQVEAGITGLLRARGVTVLRDAALVRAACATEPNTTPCHR